MKKYIIIILITIISYPLFAQKEDMTWITGGSFVFSTKFNDDSVSTNYYIDSTLGWGIYSLGGNSSISDSDGNLQFFSDGMNVYHKDYHLMEGGYKLAPEGYYVGDDGWGGYSQTSIILPLEDQKYYLIMPMASDYRYEQWFQSTNQDSIGFDLLWYNIIDMKENNGLGKVIQSKIPLLENVALSKCEMMAVRHANGRDWWLLKGIKNSVAYYTFLVTSNGIIDYGIQSFTKYAQFEDWQLQGQCMFSQDGTKFATVTSGRGTINLFDFDRCSGKLSNQKHFNGIKGLTHNPSDSTELDDVPTGSVAFSPNGRFLYVAGRFRIDQYDLQDADTNTWHYHVADLDTTYNWFMGYNTMYLGPNNKLYVGNWAGLGDHMSIINNPNEKGNACTFCPRCLKMPLNYGATTPPCMPNYRLGVLKGSACDSLSEPPPPPPKEGLWLVYPNPATSKITIEYVLSDNQQCSLQLIDLSGRIVKEVSLSNKSNKIEISVSELATGIYTLKQLINKKQVRVNKLVVE